MVPELTSRIELSNRAHTIQRPHSESYFTNGFKDTDNHRVKKHRERSGTSRVVPQALPPSLDMSLCSETMVKFAKWALQVYPTRQGAFKFQSISVSYPRSQVGKLQSLFLFTKTKQKQKTGQLPVFINKVLVKHYHNCLLNIVYGCFPTTKQNWVDTRETMWPTCLNINYLTL